MEPEIMDLTDYYPPTFLLGFWNVVFQEGVRGNHILFDAIQPLGSPTPSSLEIVWAKLLMCENLSEARNYLRSQSPESLREVERLYYVWLDATRDDLKSALN